MTAKRLPSVVVCRARIESLLIGLTSVAVAAFLGVSIIACSGAEAKDGDLLPDHLFIGRRVPERLPEPSAPEPGPDHLVAPPGEEGYFPMRLDQQPFVLNVDTTVNLTDDLNRFYWNPKWLGEVWTPLDQGVVIEKATRLMTTWPEYDYFSQWRHLNSVHKFFEKWSGFGP